MSDFLLILLPGMMYFWILFVGQGAMQEVLYEKDTRVLPRILSCPVTPTQYILSKMLRCWALCSITLVLLLMTSALLFGMKWGNPLLVLTVVVVWTLSMTGLLAVIYSVVRTREQASVLSPMVLLLCAMLGGSMFPYDSLPKFLQMVGQFTPNRWAVLVLQGTARGRPLGEFLAPLAGLFALGVVGSLLAFVLFRRQLADGGRA